MENCGSWSLTGWPPLGYAVTEDTRVLKLKIEVQTKTETSENQRSELFIGNGPYEVVSHSLPHQWILVVKLAGFNITTPVL